jgi:N-acetylneuraminic acid mutarotase
MSVARQNMQGVEVNGLIYTFGGDPNDTTNGAADFKYYDPVANSWTVSKVGPVRRTLHGMCVLDGKIWVHAGKGASANLGDLWVYDQGADTWTQKLATTLRQYPGFAGWDNKLYVSTGFTTAQQADLKCYDIATNTWSTLTGFGGAGRSRSTLTALDGKLYVLGGYTSVYFADFYVYDIAAGSWLQLPDLPFGAVGGHRTVALDGKLYVHGGRLTGNTPNKQMWCYDPVAAEWTQMANAPIGRDTPFMAANNVDGKIYVGGGWIIGGTVSAEVWRFTP